MVGGVFGDLPWFDSLRELYRLHDELSGISASASSLVAPVAAEVAAAKSALLRSGWGAAGKGWEELREMPSGLAMFMIATSTVDDIAGEAPAAAPAASDAEVPGPTTNKAFLFIKPHAVTDAVKAMVPTMLAEAGINILSEGAISSEDIDAKMFIDKHYYAIASKATLLKPTELTIPAKGLAEFESKFGLTWEAALEAGKVFNALDACKQLELDADAIDKVWGATKKAGNLIKFGGGFYVGLIDSVEGKEPIYALNCFFMSMRNKFTAPGLSIYYYDVEWDQARLSWGDFRGQILGPTDPTTAPATSVRGAIFAKWEELGLDHVPDTGDNGVHASASPFEGLAERVNWLGADLAGDAFGAALVGAGIPAETLAAWSVDPVVPYADGGKGSLFDALEDMDAEPCLKKAVALAAL